VDLEIRGGSVLAVAPREVSLESGELFSSVRPGGGRFVVRIGENRVIVHGTEFWTARRGDEGAVCLLRGRVEVVGPSGRLAWLAPGEGWRSSSAAPSFPEDLPCRVAPAAPAPAVPVVAEVAAKPVRRDPHPVAAPAPAPSSAATVDVSSPSSALAAENALYRLGESRRRSGDARGALDAWLEYQRRFPGGAFAEEVDLGVLETELRLGSPLALDAAERYLVLWPASHRAPDVHGLYGALLFRAGRPAEALAEYERALAGGPSSLRRDEALYGRAACLDRLGRADPAADAYRAYLRDLPEGRFAARARAALGDADDAR
jgi:TolA-binding protein